jgi:hypothetical protein
MAATLSLILTAVLLVGLVVWMVVARQKRDASWRQLAAELGASFVKGGLFQGSKVLASFQNWTITLDTYSVPSGDSNTTYTRIRAPFENRDDLQLRIVREGLFGKLGKVLGAQDLEIGVPEFDKDFIVQGSNEMKVRSLLADAKIRGLIEGQRSISLTVKGGDLRFETQGVIQDIPRLKSLFELFKELLPRLDR